MNFKEGTRLNILLTGLLDTLCYSMAKQLIDDLHLRASNGARMKPKSLAKAIRKHITKQWNQFLSNEENNMLPNKFEKRAVGYAVKYNGVIVPQTFVLGTDSYQRIVARRSFTSWAKERNMWGVTFKSAEIRGEVILVKLKEVKA